MAGPFPIFTLRDDQWNEIAEHLGMADDARWDIDNVIGMYHGFQINDSARLPPAEVSREFEALKNETLALRSRFARVLENPDAHFALTSVRQPPGWPGTLSHPTRLDGHRRLWEAMAGLERLADWLAIASHRVERKKSGPDTGNVYWLVAALDAVREKFTGKRITRSYKDDASKNYITTVCRIADSTIGDGTIDNAIKDRVTRRAVGELAGAVTG